MVAQCLTFIITVLFIPMWLTESRSFEGFAYVATRDRRRSTSGLRRFPHHHRQWPPHHGAVLRPTPRRHHVEQAFDDGPAPQGAAHPRPHQGLIFSPGGKRPRYLLRKLWR